MLLGCALLVVTILVAIIFACVCYKSKTPSEEVDSVGSESLSSKEKRTLALMDEYNIIPNQNIRRISLDEVEKVQV